MRKLAIASLLVAGVALSGSVFAQDGAAAPQTGSAPATKSATHHHAKSSHKSHKGSKNSKKSAMPATTTSP
ncbi:hypothetical protein RKE25_17005 [Dyella sp. BiH032]|uniref:hypothetical protein n=1 Tax=Dyella sp. BiH032 TaxID=3075430 RepID=UPI0028935AB7|nr:hypothetical protein [Dyella sp. BiH032]WNL45104.1 hypothetical protein RKE25_17005 [Dyella sp. BiH032]